jgi:hypothetical protein
MNQDLANEKHGINHQNNQSLQCEIQCAQKLLLVALTCVSNEMKQ